MQKITVVEAMDMIQEDIVADICMITIAEI